MLGEHTLTHDHADEQPVTRTQTGLQIPDGVAVITVEGRDAQNGYGGATVEVEVSSQRMSSRRRRGPSHRSGKYSVTGVGGLPVAADAAVGHGIAGRARR